ncbi:hypothetical protein [Sandarakinorhabdus oryzae]|uniref:hypothetical protein n=1 Tax=Sandarakinorhabdus oryzae TaxID=2675220 RepID=UPI0012E1DEFF|nr:hypothetical protein [Sandarakinorhabdus oryzae]
MAFEPPLTWREGQLVWWWFVITGTAVAAMLMGVLWWLALLIVSIPVLLAAVAAPTLALYLSAALLAWLPLRSHPARGRIAVFAALLVVGLAVPTAMNLYLGSQVRAAAAADTGEPVVLGPGGGTVAWLEDDRAYCSTQCLRFLITGRVQAVLLGPALTGPPASGQRTVRLRLVPRSGDRDCPMSPGVEELVGVYYLSLIDPDLCVAIDQAPLSAARLIFNVQFQRARRWDAKLPSLGHNMRRVEVFGWQAGRPVLMFRRTKAETRKVGLPLALLPPQVADDEKPADWWRAGGSFTAGNVPSDPMLVLNERLYVPEFDDRR